MAYVYLVDSKTGSALVHSDGIAEYLENFPENKVVCVIETDNFRLAQVVKDVESGYLPVEDLHKFIVALCSYYGYSVERKDG
jgi:hypothetical protein